jgi:maleylpyruvate isomerase
VPPSRGPGYRDAMTPELTVLADHTERLLTTARSLTDPAAPSLCEGWSRGHVLTHVARNAEAIGRLASWAVTGQRQEMYPGGQEVRDADIEAGAHRPLTELVRDVADTAAGLAPQLEPLGGPLAAEEVEMRGGMRVPATGLPFLRLREVVYHHVDLDAGFGFDDVEAELQRRFVADAVHRLGLGSRPPAVVVRADEGDTWTVGAGTTTVTGSLAGILLWLARRDASRVRAVDGDVPTLPRGA